MALTEEQFDAWWKENGIESATFAEKSAARKGWNAAIAALPKPEAVGTKFYPAPQPEYKAQRDAERYRWLRDSENQVTEDDPCVSDSFFNTWFGEELDKVIDEMIARNAAIASVKGGA